VEGENFSLFMQGGDFFGYFFHGWKKVTPAAGET